MVSSPFHRCYALILAAFIIAAGCCCKDHTQPFPPPAPTTGQGPNNVFYAGVATVDITPEIGVPLSGYGGKLRRLSFPDLNPFNYHTFLEPSKGILDSIYAKSLIIDNGSERVCIVSLDAIASDGEVIDLAHEKAVIQGFSIPKEKVLVCSSHTHSGPGAMSNKWLWVLTAADFCVNKVREDFTDKIAESMVKAEQNMVPALIGTGTASLVGVTRNRRADESPNLDSSDIDDQLGIIKVDKTDGTPLATVWNFAIHGTSHGEDNYDYSADNMGAVSALVEQTVGGTALFINGSEGDIAPDGSIAQISPIIANAIEITRQSITTHGWLDLETAYEIVNFGNPQLDASVERVQATSGGPLNILGFMEQYDINPGMTFVMDSSWVENEFRFQAIRIGKTLLSSVPGEPISLVGFEIRNKTLAMGYDKVFICALANNHMAYVTTETEYYVGGYEALGTLFGPKTGENVINTCEKVAETIKP